MKSADFVILDGSYPAA